MVIPATVARFWIKDGCSFTLVCQFWSGNKWKWDGQHSYSKHNFYSRLVMEAGWLEI